MKAQIYKDFSLPYLITKLSRAVLKEYEVKTKDLGVSPLQGGILHVISEMTPVSQSVICDVLFIDKVSLSKMISVLEKKKLIEIVKNADRRSKFWKLTDKGSALLKKVQSIDAQVESKLKGDLKNLGINSMDVSDSLRALLIRISENH